MDLAKVGRQVRPANVLEHSDRCNAIERMVLGDIAIVEEMHLDASPEAAVVDQPVHIGVLVP